MTSRVLSLASPLLVLGIALVCEWRTPELDTQAALQEYVEASTVSQTRRDALTTKPLAAPRPAPDALSVDIQVEWFWVDERAMNVVLRNRESTPVRVADARLVDPHGIPIRTSTASRRSWLLQPNKAEVCYFVIPQEQLGESLTLQLMDDDRRLIVHRALNAVSRRNELACVAFADDLSTVFAQAPVAERVRALSDVKATVDGFPARIREWSCVRLSDDGWMLCLEIEPTRLLIENEQLLVEIETASRDLMWAGRTWSPFFTAWSQYDYPLRVTAVERRGDVLRLGVYNESDARKLPIVVDRVLVQHEDVTARSRGLDVPLPADRHAYAVDERIIEVPAPNSSPPHQVDLMYHVSAGYEHEEGDEQSLSVLIDDRVRFPIGRKNGPVLPGCVAMWHEGLRDIADVTRVHAIARELQADGMKWPTYVRLLEGTNLERIASLAPCCDLVVVGQPWYTRGGYTDAARAFIDYFHSCRAATRNAFVISAGSDPQCRFSPQDVQWLSLGALAAGSKGIVFRRPTSALGTDVRTCIDAIRREFEFLERIRPLVSQSAPAPLVSSCNQRGIHVQALLAGTDKILLVVLNEWCNRAVPNRDLPFRAVHRDGVDVALDLGPTWIAQDTALDLRTGRGLTVEASGNQTVVHLEDIEIGSILLLERDTAPARAVKAVKNSATGENGHAKPIRVASTPFLNLGYVSPGAEREFLVEVENISDQQVQLVGMPSESTRLVHNRILLDPCIVPPNQSSTIRGRLIPAAGAGEIVGCDVVDRASGAIVFPIYVAFDAHPRVFLQPTFHDWGTFSALTDRHRRTVRLSGPELDRFTIQSVEVNAAAVDVLVAPDGKSLSYALRSTALGRIDERIAIHAVSSNGLEHVPLGFRFIANRAGPYIAEPSQLAFLDHGTVARFKVRITSADLNRFQVWLADQSAPGVSAAIESDRAQSTHVIQVTVNPTRLIGDSATLQLICRSEPTRATSLRIPIRRVRVGASEVEPPRDESSLDLHHVRAAVDEVVRSAQEINWDAQLPPWARMHLLLMYPPVGTGDLGCDRARRLVLQSVIGQSGSVDPWRPFDVRHGLPYPRSQRSPFRLEDHRDQYLHILSLLEVPLDTPLLVGAAPYTVNDLLSASLLESRTTGDLSWTVSAYSYYVKAGATWSNKFGEELSPPQLIEQLRSQHSASCGDTHRLFALARAVQAMPPSDALSLAITDDLARAVAAAKVSQRPDGLFDPADWAAEDDHDGVNRGGHVLEWLTVALSAGQLREEWILRAVGALNAAVLARLQEIESEFRAADTQSLGRIGQTSHAVSALLRWRMRVTDSEGGGM